MRLTKAHKDQIAKHVLAPYLDVSDLQAQACDMEEAYYHEIMDKHLPVIEKLPHGFMQMSTNISRLYYASFCDYAYRGKATTYQIDHPSLVMRKPRPIAYNQVEAPDGHWLRAKYKDLIEAWKHRVDKLQAIQDELWSVMKPCNTDAKLIRVWPEAAKIIEENVIIQHPAPALYRATKLEELLR